MARVDTPVEPSPDDDAPETERTFQYKTAGAVPELDRLAMIVEIMEVMTEVEARGVLAYLGARLNAKSDSFL